MADMNSASDGYDMGDGFFDDFQKGPFYDPLENPWIIADGVMNFPASEYSAEENIKALFAGEKITLAQDPAYLIIMDECVSTRYDNILKDYGFCTHRLERGTKDRTIMDASNRWFAPVVTMDNDFKNHPLAILGRHTLEEDLIAGVRGKLAEIELFMTIYIKPIVDAIGDDGCVYGEIYGA